MFEDFCRLPIEDKLLNLFINYKVRYVLNNGEHFLPTNEWRTIYLKNNVTLSYIYIIELIFIILASIYILFIYYKYLKRLYEKKMNL